MQKDAQSIYQSYLIRCWLVSSSTESEYPIWRFELREVSAEPQKHRFSDLEQLKTFLSATLALMAVDKERDDDSENSRKGE